MIKYVQKRNIAPAVFWSKTRIYPHCLVLVGSRNGFERKFKIELK